MHSSSTPIDLDRDTVFFDNNYANIYFNHRSIHNLTEKENDKIINETNYVRFDNMLCMTFFVGLDSSYKQNNILNSDFYLHDKNVVSNKITPFNENLSNKGNKIEIPFNPLKVSKSYGQENTDELLQQVSEEPFEDADNIENIQDYFKIPEDLKYPRYYNHYSLMRLNSNISVFGTLEEIDGSMLTERSLKGMKCEVIKNGLDARNRTINISDHITLLELKINENNKPTYSIESYSDEEYTDIVTGHDVLLKRSFAYTTKIINGQAVTVFDTNASSYSSNFSNKIMFYTEDDNNIIPFVDRNIISDESNHTAKNDYNTGNIYSTNGYDQDKSYGSGPDSCAFRGELD